MRPTDKRTETTAAVGGIDWHALARAEHVVHFSPRNPTLIDLVGDFLAPGLREGAACIVVATPEHQVLLEEALSGRGIDPADVVEREVLTLCDAAAMLHAFVRNGEPDAGLFFEVVGGLVQRAARRTSVHPVRLFGAMADLLARQGASDGALRLEQLWNDLARIHPFSLLCAYPVRRSGAASDAVPFLHICEEHARSLPGESERVRPLARLEREVRALDAELSERKRTQREMQSRMEQMARASRRKDELLTALGVELQHPLAALRNAVLAARLSPQQRERALAIALRQTRELARHIDDLVDVTRVSQGRIAIERRPLSLGEVLESAVEATRARLDARRHRLSIPAAGRDVYVDGDRARLEQVVENLLINAASYTAPDGRIRVSVEQRGAEAILSVTDSGVGIEAERLTAVFEPFTPADPVANREQRRGLHMGLARAREIVELHGGHIEAYSEGPGKGSEFVLRLPALAQVPSCTPSSDPEPRRHARILIVVDDPGAADALAVLLDVLGHQVAVAHDGDVALRIAQETSPDLILIDMHAPGQGCALARRIRASADLGQVSLVALIAQGEVVDRQRATDSGFCCLLSQPVEIERLREILRLLPDRAPPA